MSTEQSPFPPGFTLSTPRLQITPLDPTNLTHCTFLVRNTGMDTPEKAAAFIQNRVIPSYARNRYAQFLVSRHDGKHIGLVSLMKGYLVPDVGFKILPEESGKGYATEAGKRLLEYAREDLGIEGAFGFCAPENMGSRRVMEKLGMVFKGVGELTSFAGQKTAVYALPDMGDFGVYNLTEKLEV